MKAVVVKEFYETLGELHVSEVPKPSPEQDELLIKVLAAGVNFVDTLYVCPTQKLLYFFFFSFVS